MKKAIILLSGGLDSYTTAKLAQIEGFTLTALSFAYGQKHSIELKSAKKIAKTLNIKNHIIIEIEPNIFKNTSLVGDISVPKSRKLEQKEIPNTYVPARNILFLTYALALAESYNINDIFIGANIMDYSGYPDCRPEFIKSYNHMANIGTKIGLEQGLKINAPLLKLSKKEIIALGRKHNLDYSLSISCYDPDEQGRACGKCDSCQYRLKGFAENNIEDPAIYE